jgi:hypothetical protein
MSPSPEWWDTHCHLPGTVDDRCEGCACDNALQAMHDLLVWTLCQGFTEPETALIRRGYNAGLDDASAMVLEAKYR